MIRGTEQFERHEDTVKETRRGQIYDELEDMDNGERTELRPLKR